MSDAATWSAQKTGPEYIAWTQGIDAQKTPGDLLSASVSTLPPKLATGDLAPFANAPAARYSASKYVELQNDGILGVNDVAVDGGNGYIYVLAPSSVIGAAPHTMTSFESAQNDVFTAGDAAAGALGLPSLDNVESILKVTGIAILGIIAVGLLHEVHRGTS